MGGDVAVCSHFDGELVELLAHLGERVRRHQAIGWLVASDVRTHAAGHRGIEEGFVGASSG
jgi:hypothetical protein